MKRTEITYRKEGKGIVRILDFKNVATLYELPYIYSAGYPHYYRHEQALYIVPDKQTTIAIQKGRRYSTIGFSYYVQIMKQAGERLARIQRPYTKKELFCTIPMSKWEYAEVYLIRKQPSSSKIIRRVNKDGSITLII
jgi:hypothetical protein